MTKKTLSKEERKSFTTISQSRDLNEYEYKTYEELSKELQEVYPAAARAFELIPQMYNRLTLVDGLTHNDAFAKIHNDHAHLHGFTESNIRRYLPPNNPNIPRRVRTPRPKNSITKTFKRTVFSDTKPDDDQDFQGSENQKLEEQKRVTAMPTSTTIFTTTLNKADLGADNIQNYEASLPCRDIQRHITALRKNGKSEVWFAITINASKGEMISFKTGRNSELETNSIHGID
jgi:hypothetical protein